MLILLLFFWQGVAGVEDSTPTAAIASSNPLSTRAGAEIIRLGGNAFDAAVAITAALAVVEPYASGLGGGGLWLLHRASDGKQVLIDGRERAPELAHRSMYLDDQGNVKAAGVRNSPLAAAIPGIPAGIVYLAVEYGRLPLSVSLKPAMDYAKRGLYVSIGYQASAMASKSVLLRYPATAEIFLDQGEAPDAGFWLQQRDLEQTLAALAEQGQAGFYQGRVAARLVHEVNRHGGIWTARDLLHYQVREREPISFTYRNMRVVAAPPPSAGGIVLGQALKILEHFDIRSMNTVMRVHHVAEAMRRAYRDYAVYIGDPDLVEIPVHRLLHDDYLEGLALTLDPRKATPSPVIGDTAGPAPTGAQTTHFSVMDAEGNRVAGTLSMGSDFGSGFTVAGTGVLLNDAMSDFTMDDPGGSANVLQSSGRPLTNMTPVFIEAEDQLVILGTPGGNRIISIVLLAALDISEQVSVASWISKPRYHHQYLPDKIEFERDGLSFGDQRKLFDMGHILSETADRYGDMQAVVWDRRNNQVQAVSDPRGTGEEAVISE